MTLLSSITNRIISILTLALLATISFNSLANITPVSNMITENGVITVSVGIEATNECSSKNAYFDDINTTGTNFNDCRISITDSNNELHYLANVIAKFGTNDADDADVLLSDGYDEYDESSQYANKVDETMWTFSNLSQENKTGTWSYDNTYPDIRFWITKSGSKSSDGGFRLFWTIEDNNAEHCGIGADVDINLNFDCMNLAKSVTTGDWTTPGDKGLSHITFFGGLCTFDCDPGPHTEVPEPATIAILALGLLGLGVRRKQIMKIQK